MTMTGYDLARAVLCPRPAITAAQAEARAEARAARIRRTSPSDYAKSQVAQTLAIMGSR
jgi:hypothetical protein